MKSKEKLLFILLSMAMCLASNNVWAYNGKAAADYAKRYYESYNPNYEAYESDCTNFTSQCIVAGGFPTIALPASKVSYFDLGKTIKTKDYFSHKKYTKSFLFFSGTDFVATTTWTVAGEATGSSFYGFYNWISSREPSKVLFFETKSKSNIDSLCSVANVGDVLQIRHAGTAGKNHSYIVVSKTLKSGKYDIGLAAHTSNRYDSSLRDLITVGTIKSTDTLALERITQVDPAVFAH